MRKNSSVRESRVGGLARHTFVHVVSGSLCERLLLFSLFLFPPLLCAQQHHLVLRGGRVIDPETGFDAIRNVGVTDGKIARISAEPLSGERELNARGG